MEDAIVAELVGEAHRAADCAALFRAILGRLRVLVRWDGAAYLPLINGSALVAIGMDTGALRRYLTDHARYTEPLAKATRAVAERGGYIDTEVYNAQEIATNPFIQEIIAAQGIVSSLVVLVRIRGRVIAIVNLARKQGSRRFVPADLERMLAVAPALAVAQCAFDLELARRARRPDHAVELRRMAETAQRVAGARGSSAPPPDSMHAEFLRDFDALGEREQQVAELVALGLSNPEIAREMGTSLHTVRNQTAVIYRKLGVMGRIELALWMERCHLIDSA